MKFKKLFTFLAAAPLFLASCIMNNGICYEHVDANKDGICDVCGTAVKVDPSDGGDHDHDHGGDIPGNPCTTHVDHNLDGKCDNCGADMSVPAHDHIDADQDGKCDICGASMIVCNDHQDHNGDGKCDICGANMPVVPSGTQVTVYLVLSSVGTLDGIKGITYGDYNLEYTHMFIGKVGDPLPGKDRVKHLYKSADFEAWVAYEGAGAPTVYTTVPATNNKILYAQFTPNGTPPDIPDQDDPPTVDTTATTFTLDTSFGDQNWAMDNALIAAYAWNDNAYSRTFEGHKVDDHTFTFDIYNAMTHVLFVRAPQGTALNPLTWSAVWNQTDNLDISSYTTAKITSWSDGNWDEGKQQNHSTASWVA